MSKRKKIKRLAAVLVAVASGLVAASSASASTGPGSLLDLQKGTSTVAIANGTQTTYLTSSALTFDGSTQIAIRLMVPIYFASASSCDGNTEGLIFRLYDGSTEIGRIIDYRYNPTSATTYTDSIYDQPEGVEYLTPSSGSHTYHVTYTAINANLTGCVVQIAAGDGTGDNSPYATMAITQVSGSWGSSGSSTLAGLSDVNITSPANGDELSYNSSTSKWTNGAETSSGGGLSCGTTGNPCFVDTPSGSGLDSLLNYAWWGVWIVAGLLTWLITQRYWDRLFNWWGNPT